MAVPGIPEPRSRPQDYESLDPLGCKVFRVLDTLWCSQRTHCSCLAQICHARGQTHPSDDHHFASLDGRTQIPGSFELVVRAAANLALVGGKPYLSSDRTRDFESAEGV